MKYTISSVLGQVIAAERMRKGYSQSDLARLSGLNRSYIADMERNARNISIANLSALADAFDLPCSVLFRRMEQSLLKTRTKKNA